MTEGECFRESVNLGRFFGSMIQNQVVVPNQGTVASDNGSPPSAVAAESCACGRDGLDVGRRHLGTPPMNRSSHDEAIGVSLPTKKDFDPFGGCLDAQSAWRNFGGLSIAEALTLLRDNPIRYQEDFMFMGGRAFVFYFPVIDTYLREFQLTEHEDDSQAAILGSCVAAQLRWPTASHLAFIHSAIRSLADYVCSHTHMLAADPDEQRRIARDWQPVYHSLDSAPS